jgi:rhodanese-related sulfurtransferase
MMMNKANIFIKMLICCTISIFLISAPSCQSSKAKEADSIEYDIVQKIDVGTIQNATVGELKTALDSMDDDFVLIDLRRPKETAEGYIGGAKKMDFYQEGFGDKIKELEKDKTYYVYCRSGKRSDKTRHIMLQNGFTQVYNVTGGILAWKKADYPLVKDE